MSSATRVFDLNKPMVISALLISLNGFVVGLTNDIRTKLSTLENRKTSLMAIDEIDVSRYAYMLLLRLAYLVYLATWLIVMIKKVATVPNKRVNIIQLTSNH